MGTHYNRLAEAVLTSTYNLCFEQKCEKYQRFLSENFQFLEVKFSSYLHRRVFVMSMQSGNSCSVYYVVRRVTLSKKFNGKADTHTVETILSKLFCLFLQRGILYKERISSQRVDPI